MKTLREVGTFVGIPQDSGEFGTEQPISLGYVRRLLSGSPLVGASSSNQPFSMQAAIRQLQSLPPITLDAKVVGSSSGDEVFYPMVRIEPSPGVIISTRVHYEGGTDTLEKDVDAAGGDIGGVALNAGSWTITVRRAGIGSTGYKKLEKKLNVRVRRRPEPDRIPGSGEQTPPRPTLLATHRLEGGVVTLFVTGHGFLPEQPPQGIKIRIVDKLNPANSAPWQYTGSNEGGAIEAEIGPFPIGWVTVNALDQRRRVVISASDSRKDPNSVPRNDWLWSEGVDVEF